MKTDKSNVISATLMIIFGTLSSIIIGYMFHGFEVFNQSHPAFQFTAVGFVISTLISLGQHYKLPIYLAGCFLVIILLTLSTKSLIIQNLSFLLRDLIFGSSIAISIYVGLTIIKKYELFTRSLNKIAMWLLSVIVAYIITSVMLSILYRPTDILGYFQFQITFALLIGLGVSIGTTISETIYTKRLHSAKL